MGFYEDIRILQHKEELEKVQAGMAGDCVPIHVRLEPTEVCNLKCSFCWWHNEEKRKTLPHFKFTGKAILDRDRHLALIDELADLGTKAVSFTGAGDPLMYPHMSDLLNRIREQGLLFGVTSNMAMPLSTELLGALANASWLRWSMNAGTLGTFLAVANPKGKDPGKAFTRVQENARRVNQVRNRQSNRPAFNTSYVISDNNWKDIIPAARLGKSLGADSIAFRPDTPLERQKEPNPYNDEVMCDIKKAKEELQSEVFRVHMNLVRQEDVQIYDDPGLNCFYSNHTTYVDARGDVYPCCYTRYHSRYVIGNVLDRHFGDFWYSPDRREFYKRIFQDKCPACGYGRINKVLKRLYTGKAKVGDVLVRATPRDYFV